MSVLVRRLVQMNSLKLSVPLFLFAVLNRGSNALNVFQTIPCPVLLKLNSTPEKRISPSTEWRDQPKDWKQQPKPESLKLTCIIVVLQNSFLLESLQLQHHGLNLRKTDGGAYYRTVQKINAALPPKKKAECNDHLINLSEWQQGLFKKIFHRKSIKLLFKFG